jgi:ferredoxin--NADP+ reductase
MSAPFEERVLDVRHWTDSLFSFTTTRNAACRFKTGQFVMLGLEVDGRPLMRAYSIASPNHAEELEFFSIKVQNGPLTSRLQHLSVGDWNPRSRQSARWPQPLPSRHRNGPRAVSRHDPRPGDL